MSRQVKARAAGWYADPHAHQLRWWDGTEWTELVAPRRNLIVAVLAFLTDEPPQGESVES